MKATLLFIFTALFLLMPALSPGRCAPGNPLDAYVLRRGDIPGYIPVKEPAYYRPESLWNYIDGGALPYLDYGVGDVVTYSGRLGPDGFEVVVDIYDMADSLGAFGIYSSERFPDYDYIDIGVEGYLTENALCFWKGRYYVKVFSVEASPPSVAPIEKIAETLDERIPHGGGMPAFFSLFPDGDRLPKTESYIAKNVLGQDYLTRAFTVDYRHGGEEFRLYIIEASNAGDAEEKFNGYRDFIGEHGRLVKKRVKAGDEAFAGEEDWYGLVLFARTGRFLVGSTGLSDFDLALSHVTGIISGLKSR